MNETQNEEEKREQVVDAGGQEGSNLAIVSSWPGLGYYLSISI